MILEQGLSDSELKGAEDTFGIRFGPEHRQLLTRALPTGDRWPNWRTTRPEALRERIAWPIDSIVFDVTNNAFWPKSWGDRPGLAADAEHIARTRLADVPGLVPLYGHRYLVGAPADTPSPVFSVWQTDVIYYGDNLLDYVAHEFDVPPAHPSERTHIPFWSDLAEGAEPSEL